MDSAPPMDSTGYPINPFYKRLDESKEEIRIVTIQPGPADAPIVCQLDVKALRVEKQQYTYVPVSWSWGADQQKPYSIILQGHEFKVTKNLFEMLQKLRTAKDSALIFWIDAICINQDFKPERNQQVTMMGAIYSNCAVAVVWLGPAADDSDEVFKLYQKYSRPHRAPPGPAQLGTIPQGELNERIRLAAAKVAARPWFSRTWIVQEFALSKTVMFKCGDQVISAKGFNRLLEAGEDRYAPLRPGLEEEYETRIKKIPTYSTLWETQRSAQQNFIPNAQHTPIDNPLLQAAMGYYQNANPGSLELLYLLAQYRLFGVTDAKDKVYGFYGMARVGGQPIATSSLKPDYNLSAEEVYQQAARLIMSATQNLDIFSFLLPRARPVSQEFAQLRLPSWAPDWRRHDPDGYPLGLLFERVVRQQNLQLHATGQSRATPSGMEGYPNVLKLMGYPFDDIVAVTPVLPLRAKSSDEEYFRALCAWDDLAFSAHGYPTGEDVGHAFRMLLLYGAPMLKFWGLEPAQYHSAFANFRRCIYEIRTQGFATGSSQRFSEEDLSIVPSRLGRMLFRAVDVLKPLSPRGGISDLLNQSAFVRAMQSRCGLWALARTRGGFLARVPADCRVGDTIALLAGGSVPHVIRRAGQGYWTIVSEAAVHGLMFGEAWNESRCVQMSFI